MKRNLRVMPFWTAVLVLAAFNFGALVVPNSSMAQEELCGETTCDEEASKKRVCAYKGDPNPKCEPCGGQLCWKCGDPC